MKSLAPTCICKKKMVLRDGRFNKKFYGCSNYPRCKHTEAYDFDQVTNSKVVTGRKYDPLDFMGKKDKMRLEQITKAAGIFEAAGETVESSNDIFLLKIVVGLITKLKNESILNEDQSK